MKLINYIHIENKGIKMVRDLFLILCLVLSLIASMILAFYHSTEELFQFNLGYTLLRLSMIYFAGVISCSIVFDKFVSK